jgi:large subunit ribosomal protein L21e
MARSKSPRQKGKISLSRYFQKLAEGDRVAIVFERSLQHNIPERMQGRSGIIIGKRGKAVLVKINDQNKDKLFIVEPIHLKKLEAVQ